MNTKRIERNPIDSLIAFWRKGIHKPLLFSILFWTWVICTTFWIETASVHTVRSDNPNQNYSIITFSNLHFVQDNAQGAALTLTAPGAAFESETQEMRVDRPVIQWSDAASGKIVSASGFKGLFYARQSDSALPTAFRYLILSGTASVHGADSWVDSNVLIFDNESRCFIFPDSFQFRTTSAQLKSRKMYYDPVKDKSYPLDTLLKNNTELKSLVEQIGTLSL